MQLELDSEGLRSGPDMQREAFLSCVPNEELADWLQLPAALTVHPGELGFAIQALDAEVGEKCGISPSRAVWARPGRPPEGSRGCPDF